MQGGPLLLACEHLLEEINFVEGAKKVRSISKLL